MSRWNRIRVWVEGAIALAVALVTWAVLVPDLATIRQLPNGRQEFSRGNPPALIVYTTILIVLVAMIIVGQKRWRALRVTGWVLLLAFFTIELHLW